MKQIVIRRAVNIDCWEYEVTDSLTVGPYGSKWEAYDAARREYPQAMIKIEGVGYFNGGSPITAEDGAREVSGLSGETAPAS